MKALFEPHTQDAHEVHLYHNSKALTVWEMTWQEEERLWTELIEKYGGSDAIWKADVVGRAYGNRGNARSRQGKMEEALADFGEAINLCPWSVDPLLNRCLPFS